MIGLDKKMKMGLCRIQHLLAWKFLKQGSVSHLLRLCETILLYLIRELAHDSKPINLCLRCFYLVKFNITMNFCYAFLLRTTTTQISGMRWCCSLLWKTTLQQWCDIALKRKYRSQNSKAEQRKQKFRAKKYRLTWWETDPQMPWLRG